MPRRPAEVMDDIPHYLIPHVIRQRIRSCGEELERAMVTRTHRHFYTVSVRTRPIQREYRIVRARKGGRA
jgi:hypothetical protein